MHTGQHAILDIYNVPFELADDLDFWLSLCRETAKIAKTHILGELVHKFQPQGASGIILISESHLSFHTFPEEKFVALDFYSCGSKESFMDGVEFIVKKVTNVAPESIIKFVIRDRGKAGLSRLS